MKIHTFPTPMFEKGFVFSETEAKESLVLKILLSFCKSCLMLNREAVVVYREVEADWCDSIFTAAGCVRFSFPIPSSTLHEFLPKKIEAHVRYLVVMCVFFEKKKIFSFLAGELVT